MKSKNYWSKGLFIQGWNIKCLKDDYQLTSWHCSEIKWKSNCSRYKWEYSWFISFFRQRYWDLKCNSKLYKRKFENISKIMCLNWWLKCIIIEKKSRSRWENRKLAEIFMEKLLDNRIVHQRLTRFKLNKM